MASGVTRSDDLIERILAAVGEGTPLAEVCREPWAPHPSTWYDWINADPDLDRQFAAAREAGYDLIAARARKIARGEEGSSRDVKRDRLVVETDLKLLEKWSRRYRPAQVLSGDPETPLVPSPRRDFDPVAAAEAIKRIFANARWRKEAEEHKIVADDQPQMLPPYPGSDLA